MPSSRPNVFEPEWEPGVPPRGQPDPFRTRGARIGAKAGAERLGASLYELEPGTAICPYHLHWGNEEMLIVIEGTPTLRTPDGERVLERGEVVSFPRGAEGAHRVDNHAETVARVLMISEMNGPEVVEYPDSGKVGARSHPPGTYPPDVVRLQFRRGDAVDYFDGEI